MNTLKLRGDVRPVHTLIQLASASIVSEPSRSYSARQDAAGAYARRLASEAKRWADHTRQRCSVEPDALTSDVLDSLALSLRFRLHHFAVFADLQSESVQPALWRCARARLPFGTTLGVHEESERLVVSYGGDEIGEVGDYAPSLRPLTRFGVSAHLVGIEGVAGDQYRLLCRVLYARAGEATAALQHALGIDVGGDGYGGEEATQVALRMRPGAV